MRCWCIATSQRFLSTPSARRATHRSPHSHGLCDDFYPRPPRGGRLPYRAQAQHPHPISIHALREEGDAPPPCTPRSAGGFLSTPSARRATSARSTPSTLRTVFLSTPSARRATAKTERKPSAFVSLYTALHKLQRGAFKTNRKITPLLTQTAGIPVRSVQENHGRFRFALAGIKRSAHYPVQTPGAAQRARP